jgi:outer membrane protein TolC
MTTKMIGLVQREPLFGAKGLARRAGEQGVAADSATRDAMRREVLGETWKAYADAVAAVDQLKAARSHVGAMRRMADAARARYQAGRGRLGEPLHAEAQAAAIVADVARFETLEAEARARLATVTGFPSGRAYGPLDPLPAAQVGADVAAWRGAVAEHPLVQARTAQHEQYQLAARSARRSVWPDLEMRASYGFREPLSNNGHGSVEQDDMFSASVGFMLPLFGEDRAMGREMDAMARAAEAEAVQTELELLASVESAVARARGSARVLSLIDTVLVMHDRSLEAAWSAYSGGSADLAQALMAVHDRYENELEAADARRQLAYACADLVTLTGRPDLLGVTLPDPAARRDR